MVAHTVERRNPVEFESYGLDPSSRRREERKSKRNEREKRKEKTKQEGNRAGKDGGGVGRSHRVEFESRIVRRECHGAVEEKKKGHVNERRSTHVGVRRSRESSSSRPAWIHESRRRAEKDTRKRQ